MLLLLLRRRILDLLKTTNVRNSSTKSQQLQDCQLPAQEADKTRQGTSGKMCFLQSWLCVDKVWLLMGSTPSLVRDEHVGQQTYHV